MIEEALWAWIGKILHGSNHLVDLGRSWREDKVLVVYCGREGHKCFGYIVIVVTCKQNMYKDQPF